MAQTSFPFENVDTTETQFSQMFRNLNAGVNGTPAGTELKVTAGTGLAVSVAAGQAMVRGHYYISTAAEALALTAANGSNPRIDAIVLTLDPTANSVVLAKVDGTPASSPVAPTLTQTDAGVYQYLLATVLVPAAATVPSTITDARGFMGSRFGLWSTAGRPIAPVQGQAGYNTTISAAEAWNGTTWVLIGAAPNANAIFNGDLHLNSRGFTSSTISGFTFDRFFTNHADGTVTASAQTFTPGAAPVAGYESQNYIQLSTSGQTLASAQARFKTVVDDVRTLAGQTVTLSFFAKAATGTPNFGVHLYQNFGAGGSAEVVVIGQKIALTSSWARYSITVAMPSMSSKTINSFSHLGLNLWVSAGTNYDAITGSLGIQSTTIALWGLQLEAGTVASDFKPAGGNKVLDTVSSGSAGFDGVLVSTGLSTFSGSGTPAWAGYDVAGKNKIINGGFDFWQRGTSYAAIPGNAFLADRWSHEQDGTGNVTASQQTFTPGTAPVAGYEGQYFYRMAVTTTGTATYMNIFNKMEDVRTFAGQTVTVSFFAKADSARNASVYLLRGFGSGGSGADVAASDTSRTFSTSWARYSYTFTLPSVAGKTIGAGSYLGLIIRTSHGSGAVLDLWGIQVEAGSVATPFSRAGGTLQGERAACERYYQRWTAEGNANAYIGEGWTTTNTTGLAFYPLRTTLRIAPTSADVGGQLGIQYFTNGTSAITGFSLVTSQSTSNMAVFSIGGSGWTSNVGIHWQASGNASTYFAVSAEL